MAALGNRAGCFWVCILRQTRVPDCLRRVHERTRRCTCPLLTFDNRRPTRLDARHGHACHTCGPYPVTLASCPPPCHRAARERPCGYGRGRGRRRRAGRWHGCDDRRRRGRSGRGRGRCDGERQRDRGRGCRAATSLLYQANAAAGCRAQGRAEGALFTPLVLDDRSGYSVKRTPDPELESELHSLVPSHAWFAAVCWLVHGRNAACERNLPPTLPCVLAGGCVGTGGPREAGEGRALAGARELPRNHPLHRAQPPRDHPESARLPCSMCCMPADLFACRVELGVDH